ncbi:MAG: TetR/AcrR family transcriptional regulator [Eubacterium sp.]
MPPKAKFTRQQIIQAAVDVTREQGISAVTAREVGKQLGTSSTPVFVAFENMEDLKQEVFKEVERHYSQYINEGLNYTPMFKAFGLRMIEYAKEYPNLFKVLFMNSTESNMNYDDMIMNFPSADLCLKAIKEQTGLSEEQVELLFKQTLISGLGICYLVSSSTCGFTNEQLDEYLGLSYIGTLTAIKNLDKSKYTVHPTRRD